MLTDLLIYRGEKTAQALEANLTTLEKKLDDLLASFEESERLRVEATNDATAKPTRPDDESSREDSSSSTSKAKTDGKTEN